jgi:hypothetical protein
MDQAESRCVRQDQPATPGRGPIQAAGLAKKQCRKTPGNCGRVRVGSRKPALRVPELDPTNCAGTSLASLRSYSRIAQSRLNLGRRLPRLEPRTGTGIDILLSDCGGCCLCGTSPNQEATSPNKLGEVEMITTTSLRINAAIMWLSADQSNKNRSKLTVEYVNQN